MQSVGGDGRLDRPSENDQMLLVWLVEIIRILVWVVKGVSAVVLAIGTQLYIVFSLPLFTKVRLL